MDLIKSIITISNDLELSKQTGGNFWIFTDFSNEKKRQTKSSIQWNSWQACYGFLLRRQQKKNQIYDKSNKNNRDIPSI